MKFVCCSSHLLQESVTARLALEVEVLRERLQRQTDIAVRAEAALQQLAHSSAQEAAELRTQVGRWVGGWAGGRA